MTAMNSFSGLSNDVLGCVFEYISPQKKLIPEWARKIFMNKLKTIRKRTIDLDWDLVVLEILVEIDDIWRFANSAVLEFFYKTIQKLFGDYILWQVIDESAISLNPESINLLQTADLPYQYRSIINWRTLSANPSAKEMLLDNWGSVDWDKLSANPAFGKIIKKNFDEFEGKDINWSMLSRNHCDEALDLLEKNVDKIDWLMICENKNPNVSRILEKNLDKVDWEILSFNTCAVDILEKNLDKVDWRGVSFNQSAYSIVDKNRDKIDWEMLSLNPTAFDLLCENLDKVDWRLLNKNPAFVSILEETHRITPTTRVNDLGAVTRIFWKELATNPNLYTYDKGARTRQRNRFIRNIRY